MLLLAAATVLCAVISILVTGLIVVVMGDAVERHRCPSRGFATCRAMRDDAIKLAAVVRRRVASVDLVSTAPRRRPRAVGQSAE